MERFGLEQSNKNSFDNLDNCRQVLSTPGEANLRDWNKTVETDLSQLGFPNTFLVAADRSKDQQPYPISPEYVKESGGKFKQNEYGWRLETSMKKNPDGTQTFTAPDGTKIEAGSSVLKAKFQDGTGLDLDYEKETVTMTAKDGSKKTYNLPNDYNDHGPNEVTLVSRLRDGGTSDYKLPGGAMVTYKRHGEGFALYTPSGVRIDTTHATGKVELTWRRKSADDDD